MARNNFEEEEEFDEFENYEEEDEIKKPKERKPKKQRKQEIEEDLEDDDESIEESEEEPKNNPGTKRLDNYNWQHYRVPEFVGYMNRRTNEIITTDEAIRRILCYAEEAAENTR